MLKKSIRINVTLFVLLFASHCSDNTNNTAKSDGQSSSIGNDASVSGLKDAIVGDGLSQNKKDTVISGDQTSGTTCSTPPCAATVNSGKIVDECKSGVCSDGETCIKLKSSTKGYCVGICYLDPNNPSDFIKCPVADEANQYSLCYGISFGGNYPGYDECWWVCEFLDGDGNTVTKAAPDNKPEGESAYKCEAIFAADGNEVKYWVPQ